MFYAILKNSNNRTQEEAAPLCKGIFSDEKFRKQYYWEVTI